MDWREISRTDRLVADNEEHRVSSEGAEGINQ